VKKDWGHGGWWVEEMRWGFLSTHGPSGFITPNTKKQTKTTPPKKPKKKQNTKKKKQKNKEGLTAQEV